MDITSDLRALSQTSNSNYARPWVVRDYRELAKGPGGRSKQRLVLQPSVVNYETREVVEEGQYLEFGEDREFVEEEGNGHGDLERIREEASRDEATFNVQRETGPKEPLSDYLLMKRKYVQNLNKQRKRIEEVVEERADNEPNTERKRELQAKISKLRSVNGQGKSIGRAQAEHREFSIPRPLPDITPKPTRKGPKAIYDTKKMSDEAKVQEYLMEKRYKRALDPMHLGNRQAKKIASHDLEAVEMAELVSKPKVQTNPMKQLYVEKMKKMDQVAAVQTSKVRLIDSKNRQFQPSKDEDYYVDSINVKMQILKGLM